ncbi:MAG: c-type cytochrome [Verrucomicrobia bacterium]|nr:MAG: c-type cytochrome [Verrucomicrobiota bacterium]
MTTAAPTRLARLALAGLLLAARIAGAVPGAPKSDASLSPTSLVASPDGHTLYVGCATAGQVVVFDTATRKVLRTVPVPDAPLGLALAPDGRMLYVACAAPRSTVCLVDTARTRVVARIPAGHTAMSPVPSPDGRTLYVCNRFDNEVAFLDLASRHTTTRVRVPREPIAAALTPDGKFLLVANHIHAGRADIDVVASSVSVVDTVLGTVTREIALPNGSGLLREIRVSPDGRHAVVAHQLSRFHLPTTQVERGWVNTSAATIIDIATLSRLNTVLLDNIDAGAANPWAVAWSADGHALCVTHAGTHELSVVDFPGLLARLATLPATPDPARPVDYTAASQTAADVPNDLSFLVGLRRRIPLAGTDRGPRAMALAGTQAWIANYFSDSLAVVDLAAPRSPVESVPLSPPTATAGPGIVRRGELLFNDATMCFQGWQSCSSCHSSDARVDGFNWDNLNDGIGNPKNAKSLLQAHSTPPSMWMGVRTNASVAVRAGIRNSMFTVRPAADADALDAYLKSLRPIPSPHLAKGVLSASARRGEKLFSSPGVGCIGCHDGTFRTDMKFHNVGTVGKFDQPTDRFDTPSLVEVWRSGPYLHDGRSATLREVVTTFNPDDRHGTTSHLKPEQIDDLVEYVLSL